MPPAAINTWWWSQARRWIVAGARSSCRTRKSSITAPEFESWWHTNHPGQDDAEPDKTETHTLQVCVRYVECPTEPVPVLFDDSGCNTDACQPNRILETYAVHLIVNPVLETKDPPGVLLTWNGTTSTPRATWVAVDENKKRLYALSSTDPGLVYVYDPDTLEPLIDAPFDIGGTPLGMALSTDGTRLYVALRKTAGDAELLILDAVAMTQVTTQTVTGVSAGVLLVAASTGRLYAVAVAEHTLYAWDDPAAARCTAEHQSAQPLPGGCSHHTRRQCSICALGQRGGRGCRERPEREHGDDHGRCACGN